MQADANTITGVYGTNTGATKCSPDEEDIFRRRCKVFRFAEGEWKERGQGEILICRNKETKKARVLLHRDQTLKCAVNLPIVPGTTIELMQGSKKAATFSGADFSDGEQKTFVLAARFADPQSCEKFILAFTRMQEGKDVTPEELKVDVEPKEPKEPKEPAEQPAKQPAGQAKQEAPEKPVEDDEKPSPKPSGGSEGAAAADEKK